MLSGEHSLRMNNESVFIAFNHHPGSCRPLLSLWVKRFETSRGGIISQQTNSIESPVKLGKLDAAPMSGRSW